MKRLIISLFFTVITLYATSSCKVLQPPESVTGDGVIKVCFQSFCFKQLILSQINDAKKTIDVALYGLEDESISSALVDAKMNRNIQIRVVTDYDSEIEEGFKKLVKYGIPVVYGNTSGIMHNKYFIIDGRYIITGSTNLTSGLYEHFNNMLLFQSAALAAVFKSDFDRMFVEKRFGSTKDDVVPCPAGIRNVFTESGYFLRQLEVFPYFTPYKLCYPTVFPLDPNPMEYDDPENPGTPLNYTNVMGYVVVPLIKNASKSIQVLAFSFTDKVVVDELKKAYTNRGVKVQVWMDESQYKSSFSHSGDRIKSLAAMIKELKLCKPPDGLLHHKVIIIDDHTIIIGSMNFSNAAVESNDENFILIRNAGNLIQEFKKDIARIEQYSDYLPGMAP